MFPRNTVFYWNFIKENLGMKRLHCFPRKNNLSLFGKIRVEHHFPLICPFWDSLQIIIDFFSGNIDVIYNWKKTDVSSAKSLTFGIKLYEDHLCVLGTEMDLEYTLAASLFNQFQMGFWPLSKTIHGMLSPPWRWRGVFFRASGKSVFSYGQWETPSYGGSHNYGFPWGDSSINFLPNWQMQDQVYKSNFNKLSQRSL